MVQCRPIHRVGGALWRAKLEDIRCQRNAIKVRIQRDRVRILRKSRGLCADIICKRRCPSTGIYEKSSINGRFIAIFILDDDAPAPIFTWGGIYDRCPLSVVNTNSDGLFTKPGIDIGA